MFKNLIQFWKGKDFLSHVLGEFSEMLEDTRTMFVSAYGILMGEAVEHDKQEIYDIDRRVNARQKDIRKRIVEHLTLNPSVDAPACLLLMSVVKDAERLGDFAKNILEVYDLLEKPINKEAYEALFGSTGEEVLELFGQTKDAFLQSDEEKAAGTWQQQRKIKKRCDEVLEKVAKGRLTANEAVCFALMARYLKRIASHLTNIATSVVVPLADLDYFDEREETEP